MSNRTDPVAIATGILVTLMAAGCLPAVDGPTQANGNYNHDLSIGQIALENFPAGGYGIEGEGMDAVVEMDVDTGPDMGGGEDTGTGAPDDWCAVFCECQETMDTAYNYETCMADYGGAPAATCEALALACLDAM
jgi:hypothetical protein